jgi:hypothetical protein
MSRDIIVIIAAALAVLLISGLLIFLRRRPRKLKIVRFQDRWKELQKLCASKETWPQAITNADQLLDEALKKKRFIGKTMGERLTKAQRLLTDNEGVWFGHKLRSKLETDPETKLKEADVKQALLGIRQALKDLGALPHDK